MRFTALLRKEVRECLPWLLLAAIVLLVIGGLCLREEQAYGWYSRLAAGALLSPEIRIHYSQLEPIGPLLLLTSIGLGLALGVRQFWVPFFTRTWAFLIHRSAGRQTLLWAKFAAAALTFGVALGTTWLVLYWYAGRPEFFILPPPSRTFIEGWIFIALGLVVYLGTALTGLSTVRWYTTKIFGLAFATVVIFATVFQWRLSWAFALITLGAIVLILQAINTILRREF